MGFGNELLITIKAKDDASNTLNNIRGNLKKHASAFNAAGKRMLIASAALTAGLGVAINQAAKFQKQMAQVSTMLDQQSMKHMPRFEKQIKSMAIEFGESTSTLADGLYNILSASIPASQAMDVLDVSVKAAKAGLTDTGTAADAITTILNSYQLGAEKAADVSDLLFTIVKKGKLNFAQLAPNIGKVAAMASNAGMSLEDLGATIATLTRNGVRTEMAMTGIRGVLNGLMGATEESAAIFKDKLGFAMETASLKTHGFIEILKGIKDASMTPEEIKKMFPNVRGLVAIVAAMGDLEGMTEDVALMTDRAGAAQEAYEKNMAVTAITLARLKEAFNQLAVEIGTQLLPLVEMISKVIIGLLKWYSELGVWTKRITAYTLLFSAAILALAGSIAIIISWLPKLITGFNVVSVALKNVTVQARIATVAFKVGFYAAIIGATQLIIKLSEQTLEYYLTLKEGVQVAKLSGELQARSFHNSLVKLREIKEAVTEITPEYEKQTRSIETSRRMLEELGQLKKRDNEAEREAVSEIIRKVNELHTWYNLQMEQKAEHAEREMSLVEQLANAKKNASDEDRAAYEQVAQAKELIDLKGFKKKEKQLIFERKQKIKDAKKNITDHILLKDAISKINAIYDKKDLDLAKNTAREKKLAAIDLGITSIGIAQSILEAEGSSAKKKKAFIIALMSAELALGITRMWSAEATKGVLGIAPAVVGTAALVANYGIQMHNLTKGSSGMDSAIPALSTGSVGVADETLGSGFNETLPDTGSTSNGGGGGGVGGGSSVSGGSGGGGVTKITKIEVGGIDINLGGVNVTEENLEFTLREIGEAVKAKTVEAVTMAMQIYNVGKEADIDEEAV